MKKHMTWIILVAMIMLIAVGIVMVNSLNITDFDKEKSISAANIQHVTINSDITDVHLSESSDSQIHVHINGSASKLSNYDVLLSAEDSHLHIRAIEKNAAVSSLSLTKTIRYHVYLPSNSLQSLSVQTKFGSLYANQPLTSEQLSFKSKLGGVYLDSYTGRKLTIDTGLGNVHINHLIGGASLTTSTGHVTVDRWQMPSELNHVKTNKGNIKVGIIQPPQALSFLLYSNGVVSTDLDVPSTAIPGPVTQIGMNRITGTLGQLPEDKGQLELSSDLGSINLFKSEGISKLIK